MSRAPSEAVTALFAASRKSGKPVRSNDVALLDPRRAGKATHYMRRCPHCDGVLRIEDST